MASATVFVDDAVQGRLPAICARTGVPTRSTTVLHSPVGGLGAAAWILVFFGPLGWLALFALAVVGGGREELKVRLPYSDEATAEERPWRLLKALAGLAGAAAIILAVVDPFWSRATWLVLALITLLTSFVAHSVLYFRSVEVKLDASRRWVTLTHVHPSFADAVAARIDEANARHHSGNAG